MYEYKQHKEKAVFQTKIIQTYGVVSVIAHVFITLSTFAVKSATNVGYGIVGVIVVCSLKRVAILKRKSTYETNKYSNSIIKN